MLSRIRKLLFRTSSRIVSPFDPERSDVPDDPNDTFCIKIFNDERTTMGFVISLIENHLNLSKYDAVQLMLKVHASESLSFGRMSEQKAKSIVAGMREDIEAAGMTLRVETEHWMTGGTT